ncbi:MAG: hypothetical protein IPI67_22620 [Myxococcales bacterium]|nr:hypothetical protein [Myxococcales bacterium]
MRTALMLAGAIVVLGCGGSSEDDGPSKKKDAGSGGSAGAAGSVATGGTGAASGAGGVAGSSSGGAGGGAGNPTGGAPGCSLAAVAPGPQDIELTSSGTKRSAHLVVPTSYDATKSVPLVLVFHGYLENAGQIEKISEMTPVAEKYGAVVVYPEGMNTSWNAGKCCGTSSSTKRPDVQFVADLLDALEAKLCIDKKRVYAAGFSNGGMLSNRLACELSERIAAFGPVSGPLAVDTCEPKRPVPMIEFHGTADFVVNYNGGSLSGAKSVADNLAFWAKNAGCTDAAATSYQNGDTTCVQHSACAAGSIVRLCTVKDGGHQWPGGTSAGPAGKLTQDIDASEEMLKFFLAQPMP